MILHHELGDSAFQRSKRIKLLIVEGAILLAGNKGLKIYGLLSCSSGKRMKVKNRVFFGSEEEALALGYRPCGRCLKAKYHLWKKDKASSN